MAADLAWCDGAVVFAVGEECDSGVIEVFDDDWC